MTQASQGSIHIPLTKEQELIWIGQRLQPDIPLYNSPWQFDLNCVIDPDMFVVAYASLYKHSDTLRIIIEESDGKRFQSFAYNNANKLEVVDLTHHDDSTEAANIWIAKRAQRNFNLEYETSDSALLKLGATHWIWFLNQHHIASDAHSGPILVEQLNSFYSLAKKGKIENLENFPSFANFAKKEPSSRLESALKYWSSFDKDIAPLGQLYGRSSKKSKPASQRLLMPLGTKRFEKLQQLVKEDRFGALTQDLAYFNIFATALLGYIARVTGNDSSSLGVTTNLRSTPEQRRTAGMFVGLFPMSVQLEEGETFRHLHGKLMVESKSLFGNAVAGAGSSSGQHRFNVVLNYFSTPFNSFDGTPVKAQWLHPGFQDPTHHLRLHVAKLAEDKAPELMFDFNKDVFDEIQAKQASEHFLCFFDSFLDDPDMEVKVAPLVSQSERQTIIERFNTHTLPAAPKETVVDVFLHHAKTTPELVALKYKDNQISYGELEHQSGLVAQGLRLRGIGTGDVVGIQMRRSSDLIVGMLGIMRAGASYVPLDSGLPPMRLKGMLEDARVTLTLVQAISDKEKNSAEFQSVIIDSLISEGELNVHIPLPLIEASTNAYVIFTSGSTGRPKGVVVSHSGLARYIFWALDEYWPGAPLSMPFCTAVGVDLSLTSLYAPLVSGGTVVIYPETDIGTDLAILQAVDNDEVDLVKLTPAHLALVCEATKRRPKRLRGLIVGGEDLLTEFARRALNCFGDIAIYNEYGPTEAVVGCMTHRFNPIHDLGSSVPIGHPAKNVRIYILDLAGNPVPIGVEGELYIGGEQLARGYINNSDLTEKCFLSDPFVAKGRMYRTGDRALLTSNDTAIYLGRGDRQVKIRGVRIELGEVEQVLLRHEDVDGCVVDVYKGGINDETSYIKRCVICGLGDDCPGLTFDDEDTCSLCQNFDSYRDRSEAYWHNMEDYKAKLDIAKSKAQGNYDCIVLISGGKDSIYALYRIAALGVRILALTLDNGFISNRAKENARQVCEHLNIDHRFMSTPAMNEIFVDSLKRHADVCPGCFKVLYTLSLEIAKTEGIPMISTGLSRGQLFDTRLAPELFNDPNFDVKDIDQWILEARKIYHRVDDAVFQLMDVSTLQSGELLEDVEIVDFYRYCDIDLGEVLNFLNDETPWCRPDDTGRSTNCLINDVGIFIHKRTRGYHNYAHPYSWDVRLGHKVRDIALDELNDEIDTVKVNSILKEIGYVDEGITTKNNSEKSLVAYVTGADTLDSDALRAWVSNYLPITMIPRHITQLEKIPLSSTGKIDRDRLPNPSPQARKSVEIHEPPCSDLERMLTKFWETALRLSGIGATDNYYEIGGDSLSAIQIEVLAHDAGVTMKAAMLFEHQTIRALAIAIDDKGNAKLKTASPRKRTVNQETLEKVAAQLNKSQTKR